jgi:hypothetical protein
LLAPPTDDLHLNFVPADTNNGDEVQYYLVTNAAMVGITPDNRIGMYLNRGACQPSLLVVGAADR